MRTLIITSAMLLCLAPTSLLAQPSPPPDPNKIQVLIITGQHVLYANLHWQPDGSYHVLATAYDDHALYQGKHASRFRATASISRCCGRRNMEWDVCS
jgi:hypothetical protein